MKHFRIRAAAALALALIAAAPAVLASIYGPGEGYYYISYTHTGGVPAYQYMKVGPFASEEACWAARDIDASNGDAWFPFWGTGIQCTWVYHNEVSAFDDALSKWNTIAGGGNNPPRPLDAEKLQIIAELQRVYEIERYKRQLDEILRLAPAR